MYIKNLLFYIKAFIKPDNLYKCVNLSNTLIFSRAWNTGYATLCTRFLTSQIQIDSNRNTVNGALFGSALLFASCWINFPQLLANSDLYLPPLLLRLSTMFCVWIVKMGLLYHVLLRLSSVAKSNGPSTTWRLRPAVLSTAPRATTRLKAFGLCLFCVCLFALKCSFCTA